jgi:hypothetical protein
MKEWLLVIWLGTSSNFMIQDVFWNWEECDRARQSLISVLGAEYAVICTQDMREGRSGFPRRGSGVGIVK